MMVMKRKVIMIKNILKTWNSDGDDDKKGDYDGKDIQVVMMTTLNVIIMEHASYDVDDDEVKRDHNDKHMLKQWWWWWWRKWW